MKKVSFLGAFAFALMLFTNCHGPKKVAETTVPKASYTNAVAPIVQSYCSPCHVPSKGGNKKPYDDYSNARADIDDILRRVQLNPGERGYMPFKRSKLSDSAIAVLKKWKEDGLME